MSLHRRPSRPAQPAAFTLVELAVAAAVLILLSAIGFPTLVRSYEQQRLRQAAMELQSTLQQGRTLAQRLQGSCGISYGNDATVGVLARATPAANFSGTGTNTNRCTDANLPQLRLSQISSVVGLTLSRDSIAANNDQTASTCSSSTACAATFNTLGILSGDRQIIYLSGTRTTTQFCIHLSLNLIRVGFRNGSSGACTYARN